MSEGKKFLSRRGTEPHLWSDTVQVNDNPATPTLLTADWLRELAKEPMKDTPMVPLHQDSLLELARRLELYERGWLEAAIAWEVCASVHLQWAKGKDAVFTTRQGDYVRHGNDARIHAESIREGK